ncbi:MAG: hypothetical protein IJF92_04790 [Bacilli bacterium]|nr:hypothetical protein [Bacilli bacterium]
MIDKKDYNDILKVSKEIEEAANTINKIAKQNNIEDLGDFISTVLGYSKYLNTTVELYKDADFALSTLENNKK